MATDACSARGWGLHLFATKLHRIGPELTTIAMQCVDATGAPIAWEVVDNIVDEVTPEALESLRRTGVGIQGFFEVGERVLTPKVHAVVF